jgi:hypothetical protein
MFYNTATPLLSPVLWQGEWQMLTCYCCGRRFTRPQNRHEDHGEYFGFPALEEVSGCPFCGGGYGKTPGGYEK